MRQNTFERVSTWLQTRPGRWAVLIGIAVLELAAVSLVDAAQAQESPLLSQGAISPSGSANPIAGWTSFCARFPAECAVDPNEPALISLSAANWKVLISI